MPFEYTALFKCTCAPGAFGAIVPRMRSREAAMRICPEIWMPRVRSLRDEHIQDRHDPSAIVERVAEVHTFRMVPK